MKTRFLLWFSLQLICCFCILSGVVDAKFAARKFTLRANKVHYLTNFGCAIGECSWKVRVRFRETPRIVSRKGNSPPINLPNGAAGYLGMKVLLDETWESPEVGRTATCKSIRLARATRSLRVPFQGDWSAWEGGAMTQYMRPHHWYFMIDDCLNAFQEELAKQLNVTVDDIGPMKFEFEMEMLQYNGSHFSYELFGTSTVAIAHTLIFLIPLTYLFRRQMLMRKSGKGRVHMMVQTLNLCILMHFLGSIFHLVHLLRYAQNGVGSAIADGASDCLYLMSQTVIASLLVLIAGGYSLNVPDASSANIKKFIWPGAAFLAFIHIALVLFDRRTADERYRHLSTGAAATTVVTVIRLALWCLFAYLAVTSMGKPSTPLNVVQFLRKLLVVGSCYFLAYPLVYIVAKTVVLPYLQHRVMSNGIFVMQLVTTVWLSHLFVSTKGDFFKVSELSQSYLPGGILSPTGMYRLD